MTANVGKAAEAGFIKEISISSNEGGKAVSLQGGFFELKYYESIMSNTVKATLIYTDSGDTIDGKTCLLYTSPSPRDKRQSRMPSSA